MVSSRTSWASLRPLGLAVAILLAAVTAEGQTEWTKNEGYPVDWDLTGQAAEKGDEEASGWNLVRDVGISSNQISFNQGANGVWFFMQSATLAQEGSSYSLLTGYTTPCAEFGVEGLLCWYPQLPYTYESGFPWIGFNTTADFPPSLPWPARTLAMHPAPDKLAIVGWRSPVSDKIDIEGSFIDFDLGCGNGVAWFINRGNRTLDSGVLLPGPDTFHLGKVRISSGEVLYFIVDPLDNDYICDWTGLNLTIRRHPGN
jgi:hypothetical protein